MQETQTPARQVTVVSAGDPKGAYDAASRRGVVGSLPAASRQLLQEWCDALGAAVAVLSRGEDGWRFEGDGFPQGSEGAPEHARRAADAATAWTGIAVGTVWRREFLLILPGSADRWRSAPGLETFVARFRSTLEDPLSIAEDPRLAKLCRRYYSFLRKLAGRSGPDAHSYVLRTIATLLSARTGVFAVYAEADAVLTITATYGYPSALVEHVQIEPGSGVLGRVFASGQSILGRAEEDGRRRLRYLTDSYIAVPLRAAGRTLGVISFADKLGASAFPRHDLSLARMFAAPAALALAREGVIHALDAVSRAAVVDPVTGLFNRRHLETALDAELQRARRQQQPLSLLMIDVDDFKRVNDTFGHLEGDRLLYNVAEALRGTVRTFDLCARYGGEEFAIIMPGASLEIAAHVGERIRASVARLPVTVSIGAALLLPGDSPEDLVASADRALMAAKRAGKNAVRTDARSVSADPPVSHY